MRYLFDIIFIININLNYKLIFLLNNYVNKRKDTFINIELIVIFTFIFVAFAY